MQTAVSDWSRREPIELCHWECQETSKSPSTSTVASAGSAETPTVVRA
jgi:hypothetical protein